MSARAHLLPVLLTTVLFLGSLTLKAQQDATLTAAFTAFTDTFDTDHVVMDLEDEVLVIGRATGESGSVRIHWRNSGGADGWEAIAILSEDVRGFGRSIDLHNGLLAVGIDANDGSSQGDTGSVLIYRVDPLAVDPVRPLDTLLTPFVDPPGPGPDERFGHSVLWRGDTLMVAAVGGIYLDPSGGGTGKVYAFLRDGDHWTSCGSIQPDPIEFQLPYLGAFGEVMTGSGDNLVIGAPFSGSALMLSDPMSFTNVLGSLHFYRRDSTAFATCGWSLTAIEQDITMGPDTLFGTTASAFLTLETGRQGIHFSGQELIAHISANYTFQDTANGAYVPYGFATDDEGRVCQALSEGCHHCGLRSFHAPDDSSWPVRDSSLFPMLDRHTMGMGAWNTQGNALLVNRYDTLMGTWSTDIHMHHPDTDVWEVLFSIPEMDAGICARYNTPVVMDGTWLVRLPAWNDDACDEAHITRAEIFRLGDWVGNDDTHERNDHLVPYPNPASTSCSLMLPPGWWSLEVKDPTGRTAGTSIHVMSDRATIDVTGLSAGTYFLFAQELRSLARRTGTLIVQRP